MAKTNTGDGSLTPDQIQKTKEARAELERMYDEEIPFLEKQSKYLNLITSSQVARTERLASWLKMQELEVKRQAWEASKGTKAQAPLKEEKK